MSEEPTISISVSTANTDNVGSTSSIVKTDPIDSYSLKVNPKYVLNERAVSLPPLSSEHTTIITNNNDRNNTNNNGNVGDDRDRNNSNNNKKGRRGRNGKRPRDAKIDSADKICLATLRGETCPYGNNCRFGHDIKAYLATRLPDITVFGDKCPIFEATGYCPYGVLCRVGSGHLNMATGDNIIQLKDPQPPPITNILTKEVQFQLRKNTYPFKCKRHFEASDKNKNKNNKNEEKMDEEKKVDVNIAEKSLETDTQPEPVVDNSTNTVVVKDVGAATGNEVDVINETKNSSDTNPETAQDSLGTSESLPAYGGTTTSIPKNDSPVDMSPLPSKERKLIDFSNKIYVAPLTTVGNLPFRRIMKKFGADITCGEMALAHGILEGKASEWALLKRHPDEDIFGVQIAAGFPDMFMRTCELIENHIDVDFVDLNLGCPLDLVCDKGCGASLMLRDKKFYECLRGITKTLSCPITIKMRTGWEEKKPIAHNLVQKIQSWELPSVAAIMIHGRSRLQRYSKEADWDYIRNVAATAQDSSKRIIPIIGNGDLLNYTDYEKKVVELQTEGLSTCAMLARGALIKPWLPTEIKEHRHWDISANERFDMLKDFVKFGLENWGTDQQGVNNTRRFLLEWLSFLHRYVPVGLVQYTSNNGPQQMNQRPPAYMCGRNDLETLFLSNQSCDWIKISEMLLGPVPDDFKFEPKHKANSYVK